MSRYHLWWCAQVEDIETYAAEKKKIALELEVQRIAQDSNSWKCVCGVLNGAKSRSCDSCDEKKPPISISKPSSSTSAHTVKAKPIKQKASLGRTMSGHERQRIVHVGDRRLKVYRETLSPHKTEGKDGKDHKVINVQKVTSSHTVTENDEMRTIKEGDERLEKNTDGEEELPPRDIREAPVLGEQDTEGGVDGNEEKGVDGIEEKGVDGNQEKGVDGNEENGVNGNEEVGVDENEEEKVNGNEEK